MIEENLLHKKFYKWYGSNDYDGRHARPSAKARAIPDGAGRVFNN